MLKPVILLLAGLCLCVSNLYAEDKLEILMLNDSSELSAVEKSFLLDDAVTTILTLLKRTQKLHLVSRQLRDAESKACLEDKIDGMKQVLTEVKDDQKGFFKTKGNRVEQQEVFHRVLLSKRFVVALYNGSRSCVNGQRYARYLKRWSKHNG